MGPIPKIVPNTDMDPEKGLFPGDPYIEGAANDVVRKYVRFILPTKVLEGGLGVQESWENYITAGGLWAEWGDTMDDESKRRETADAADKHIIDMHDREVLRSNARPQRRLLQRSFRRRSSCSLARARTWRPTTLSCHRQRERDQEGNAREQVPSQAFTGSHTVRRLISNRAKGPLTPEAAKALPRIDRIVGWRDAMVND
ncbi:hypothetical protein CEP53_004037 [Fusarium sp. AF-6]|nr:hypothetical protein CEP53_004037 [Fusarium sp. AF-6]